MDKKLIRTQMTTLRKQLTTKQIADYSQKIVSNLYSQTEYQKTKAVYCYVSYKEEVITHKLIQDALSQGKKVAVPKILGNKMEFYYISDFSDLKIGAYGILEPVQIGEPAFEKEVVMIMPGLAFDKEYNRMGYGGGYYDKYISTHPDIIMMKLALAYDFQVIEQVMTDDYDVKVDRIITPTQII